MEAIGSIYSAFHRYTTTTTTKNMILGSGNFQITGKYYSMQVARHGTAGSFIPLAHVKLLIKSKFRETNIFFLAFVNNTICS